MEKTREVDEKEYQELLQAKAKLLQYENKLNRRIHPNCCDKCYQEFIHKKRSRENLKQPKTIISLDFKNIALCEEHTMMIHYSLGKWIKKNFQEWYPKRESAIPKGQDLDEKVILFDKNYKRGG